MIGPTVCDDGRQPAAPLDYSALRPPKPLRARWRVALALSYGALVILPSVLIVLIALLPPAVIIAGFVVYAFALLPTYYLDHWLLSGSGFHSLSIFGLLTLCVATMLWPLLLLSAAPVVWHSRRWRRAIWSYAAAFMLFAFVAAWQMTRSWGLFFG